MKNIIVVALLFFVMTETWGNTEIDVRDKKVWLQLLEDKNYSELDKQLTNLQVSYEKYPSTERKLLLALSSFKNSDPSLKSKIEAWLAEKPESIFSHLALGLYHNHLGWLSRGSRWSKDTTSQQFAKMRGHFRKAHDELTWVISKNPKQSIAYATILSLETARSKKQQKLLFNEAIKHNPLSSVIRRVYLMGLLPKWGGSFDEIEKFLLETSPLYSQNTDLKRQEGFLEYAHGDKIFTSEEKNAYRDALAYLDKAVSKSTNTRYLSKRAQIHKYMKSYQKSINDYTKALESAPQDSDYLTGRGNVYYKLEEYDLALADIDEAILYDKMNPNALQTRGFIYYMTDKKDKALLSLTDSLIYGFEKKSTHKYIGYIHYYTKNNYRLAAESLKTSSELGNEDSYIWYLITASQWHNRDCEFVKSANIYAQRCEESGECKKKNLDWALKSAAYAKRSTCRQ